MIVQTKAIVLKAIDYQESSKIVTVLTEELGKIAVIAKGARKPKSKFAALFEAGNILELVLYDKKNRSVQTLKEASYELRTFKTKREIDRLSLVIRIVELVEQLVHDNEVNTEFFELLFTILNWIEEVEDVNPALFPYVQIRFIQLMGIGFDSSEIFEELPPSMIQKSPGLELETGRITQDAVAGHFYPLSKHQFDFILGSLSAKSKELFLIPFTKSERLALIKLLDKYLQYHVEGVRNRKSDNVFVDFL